MAFNKNTHFNFFAGLLILTVLTLPLVSTENIDCNGKAFHCVNSTHFKICVDFGGGVSKTVDEFLIPCPTNTVCRDVNKFECEHQVATTPSTVRQSDVTNEQSETSVTPTWGKVETTTWLSKYKTNKIEDLNSDFNTTVIVKELSSSVFSDDSTGNITTATMTTTTTTFVGQLNKVELNNDNNVQFYDLDNLSDSATVSYISASSYGSVPSYDKLSSSTEKVNDTLLSFASFNNTRNYLGDSSLVTPFEPFENVTENIRNTDEKQTYEIFTNNSNKTKTAVKSENSLLISQNKSTSTRPEVFENHNIYSTTAINVTTDFPATLIPTEIVNIELKDENVADSSINVFNTATTTASYNVDNKHFNQSNDAALLTLPYNYEIIGNISDDATTNAQISIYTESSQIEASTNVINRNFNISKTVQGNILARNEPLLTTSYSSTEISPTTLVHKSKNMFIDSSDFKNNVEKLNTPLNYSQNYEENGENLMYINDLNTINQYQTNVSTGVLAQNDKNYEFNLTVTNTEEPLVSLLPTILLSSTTKPSDSLKPNTLSHNLSIVFTDFNISKTGISTPTNFKPSETPITNDVSNVTLFSVFNPINEKQNISSLESNNETKFTEEISTDDQLFSHLYDNNTESNPQKINNTAGFVDSGANTSSKEVYTITTPREFNSDSEYNINVNLTTTLNYTPNPENYESIKVNRESYQNQKSTHALSSTQSFIDVKENNVLATTVTSTIYSPQHVVIINDTLLNTYNEPFLTSKTKSIDSNKAQAPNNLKQTNTHIQQVSIKNENKSMNNEFINISVNQSIVDDNLHKTPTKEEWIKNATKNNRRNNNIFSPLTIPLYHENKTKLDMKQNNTMAATDDVNSYLLSTKPEQSTETYSVTQNDFDTTVYLKNNLTEVSVLPYMNDNTASYHSGVTSSKINRNLFYTPNILKDTNNNKQETFETYTTFRSLPSPMKVSSQPHDNDFMSGDDVTKNNNLLSITNTHENEYYNRMTTKGYSVNVHLDYVTNVEKITESNNNQNKTPIDTSTQPTGKIKSSVFYTNVDNYPKKNNVFEVKRTPSFKVFQNLSSSNSNIITNYNSTSRPKYNVTNKDNTNFNLLVGKNPNQKEPSKTNLNEQITLIQNFTCLNRDRGKYSDKSDCKNFYICIGKLNPIIGMCPEDTVFSEINKQCTKNLSHCVRNNQFKCLSSGRFIDVLSEGYFYVCVKKLDGYLRLKLQCQKGYHLNKENIICSSKDTSLENISKTINDNSSNEHKSKEIVHLKNYEVKFYCKKEGKFEHPHDCRKYFVCTKGSKSEFRRKIKKCDSDEVFNKDKRKCVDYDSYEC